MSDKTTIEDDGAAKDIKAYIRAYLSQEGVTPTLGGFINFVSARIPSYNQRDILGSPIVMSALLGANRQPITKEKPEPKLQLQPPSILERTITVAQFVERYRSREGQGGFKRKLIKKYGCKCMATGKETSDIIEAAHIAPYNKSKNHSPDNGLLLSRDIHKLFDNGKLSFDPDNEYAIVKDPTIKDELGLLSNLTPDKGALQVDDEALRIRHADFKALMKGAKL